MLCTTRSWHQIQVQSIGAPQFVRQVFHFQNIRSWLKLLSAYFHYGITLAQYFDQLLKLTKLKIDVSRRINYLID